MGKSSLLLRFTVSFHEVEVMQCVCVCVCVCVSVCVWSVHLWYGCMCSASVECLHTVRTRVLLVHVLGLFIFDEHDCTNLCTYHEVM